MAKRYAGLRRNDEEGGIKSPFRLWANEFRKFLLDFPMCLLYNDIVGNHKIFEICGNNLWVLAITRAGKGQTIIE